MFILISSIHLALENPLNNPEGGLARALRQLDIVMTTIFAFEIFIKVVAFGLIMNGPKSYLLSGWNIIDLLIVIVSYLALVDGVPNV